MFFNSRHCTDSWAHCLYFCRVRNYNRHISVQTEFYKRNVAEVVAHCQYHNDNTFLRGDLWQAKSEK